METDAMKPRDAGYSAATDIEAWTIPAAEIGTDGMALLSRLQELAPELPVIIMTAHSDLDSAVSASNPRRVAVGS